MQGTSPKPVGLRRWLFYLTLAAIVPTLLLAAYAVVEFDRASRRAILADLNQRAHVLQRSTERMIDLAAASVSSMAESDSAQVGDWQGLYEQARRVIAHDELLHVVTLVDSEGNLVFHTAIPYGKSLFKANDPATFEATLRTGRVSVSTAFKSPISPKTVVAISVPVRQAGQIRYVLRAIILTESIDRLLAEAALPEGWIAGIADARGIQLARSVRPENFIGKPASASFQEGIRRGDGLPAKGTSLEGNRSTLVVLPVHGGDWHLGLAVPDAVLDATLDQAIQRIAGLAAISLGLALALSALFGGFLVRQARALVAAVAAPSQSEPARAGLRIKEFIALSAGVDAARQRESDATGLMTAARFERDETHDLYERAPCGYHSLDQEGRLVRMNETALNWLGYRWEEVQGRHLTDLLTAESQATFAVNFPRFLATGQVNDVELTLVRKDGSTFPVSASATALRHADGRLLSSRSTLFNITDRKRLEAQLDQLARTDTLTGLRNRRDFHERAGQELLRVQRSGNAMAVLMLDIDHFKRVNDTHGHAGGDLVLQALAMTCLPLLRNIDLLARMGGEEFAVLLPETPAERAAEVAERLRRAIEACMVTLPDAKTVAFTVSIGIGLVEADETDIDAVLRRADAALYRAKAGGRNRVEMATTADEAA